MTPEVTLLPAADGVHPFSPLEFDMILPMCHPRWSHENIIKSILAADKWWLTF